MGDVASQPDCWRAGRLGAALLAWQRVDRDAPATAGATAP